MTEICPLCENADTEDLLYPRATNHNGIKFLSHVYFSYCPYCESDIQTGSNMERTSTERHAKKIAIDNNTYTGFTWIVTNSNGIEDF